MICVECDLLQHVVVYDTERHLSYKQKEVEEKEDERC